MVVPEVMAAQAETVAGAVMVVLSILRSRRTSTEASAHLQVAASAAVAGTAANLDRVEWPAPQVEAVAAVEALAVHLAPAARGELDRREIQATPVAVGIPDRPAVTEPMAL